MKELAIWLISGKNVAQFLQGQISADVYKEMQPFCYCNAKGRVCAIGWFFSEKNEYFLILAQNDANAMFEKWQPYAKFSDIKTTKVQDRFVNIQGNKIVIEKSHRDNNWLEFFLSNKIAILEEDSRLRFTPHMLGLNKLGAIDFNKGCFLGQEIIARTQHLGLQKRNLRTFISTGNIKKTDKVLDESENIVGEIIFVYKDKFQAIVRDAKKYIVNRLEVKEL